MGNLNIAVDASCWLNQRGYGRHARALFREVVSLDRENRYVFVTDDEAALECFPRGVEARLVPSSRPTMQAASASGARALRDLWRMSRAFSLPIYDMVLVPSIYSYVPVISGAKKIVFIHDIIPEKYPGLTLPDLKSRIFWKLKVTLGRIQADAIVTVSEYSRRLILESFNVDPEHVYVVGEASDSVFRVLDERHSESRLADMDIGKEDRIIAYVGGFGPHKNLGSLIQVMSRLMGGDEFSDLKLLLIGEHKNEVFHSASAELQRQIQASGLSRNVLFTGFLPDDELVALLNRATLLALPSLMEGFGLPAVEAAACGCPVVATCESPLPELLGEGGIYIDPSSPDQLERALREILTSQSRRNRMRSSALAASSQLTWERSARQMLDVIERMAQR